MTRSTALERGVGLAPAAAPLLREREQFGDGAILGPLSDFISADQASALLVEAVSWGLPFRAVLVRDRDVAQAVREWHATDTRVRSSSPSPGAAQ